MIQEEYEERFEEYEKDFATWSTRELKEELHDVKKTLVTLYKQREDPRYHRWIQIQIKVDNDIDYWERIKEILEKIIKSRR